MTNQFQALVDDLFSAECVPDRAAVEQAEARQAREQRLQAARAAITTEDVLDIARGALRSTGALERTQRWYEVARGVRKSRDGRPMRFLALLGQPGLGKTVAAAWLLGEVGGTYITAPELGRLRSSSFWRDQDTFRSILGVRLVVVDDLGAESASAEEALFDLVNARQVERAMTVLTGNITRQQLLERYGERAVRRMEHQGAIFELKGPDMRRGANMGGG